MFILTINGRESEGAYSVIDDEGEHILYLFQEEDDGYPEMHVIEIEDKVMVKTCEMHGYQYTVITPDDIVIPPNTEHDFI